MQPVAGRQLLKAVFETPLHQFLVPPIFLPFSEACLIPSSNLCPFIYRIFRSRILPCPQLRSGSALTLHHKLTPLLPVLWYTFFTDSDPQIPPIILLHLEARRRHLPPFL
jgi:hypothetical protein